MNDWKHTATKLAQDARQTEPVVTDEWRGLLGYLRKHEDPLSAEIVELNQLAKRCGRTPADTLELLEQAEAAGEVWIYARGRKP